MTRYNDRPRTCWNCQDPLLWGLFCKACVRAYAAGIGTLLAGVTARACFVVLLLLAIAAPAAAQNRDAVERAKADLEAQHVNLQGACGALRITNLVAWRARPAYGLLRKVGGFRAVLTADGCVDGEASSDPEGRATDYLIQRSSGVGFDILGDAGGANRPGWDGPENAPDMVERNWQQFREPIDPRGYYREDTAPPAPFPPPSPTPPPAPVPPPAPPPLPSTDLAPVLSALTVMSGQILALREQLAALSAQQQADTEAIRGDIKSFRQAANDVLKNVLKYIGPAVAALFAGRATK